MEQIADRGLWLPVLRARPEPWLDLDLVVDTAPSMVIWQPAVRALVLLLRRQDAFARVRVLRLQRLAAGRGLALVDESGRPQRGEPPVTNPLRRRLLWVLSDCVADDWDGGGPLAKLLRRRARQGPVALVQLLPQRLWPATALGAMREVSLCAAAPARPNRLLGADLKPWPPGALKLPVLTLDPHALRTWAALIDGRADTWCAGLAFQAPPDLPAGSPAAALPAPTDAQRLAEFRDRASPQARRLAQDFAVLPLNLPIMRLAQQVLMGSDGRLTHLAEVLLGGLLERIDTRWPPEQRASDPQAIPFDFIGTIRERLLEDLTPGQVQSIDRRMALIVEQRLGQVTDFFALIASADGPRRLRLDARSLPFARIRLKVWQRMGGSFLPRAAALAAHIADCERAAAAPDPLPAPPVAPGAVLLVSRDPVSAAALRRAYTERSGADPAAYRGGPLDYDDLGTINGARVLHCLIEPGLEQADAEAALARALKASEAGTVIEIGLAVGTDPATQRPGEVVIGEGVRTGSGGVVLSATPRLIESFALALGTWRGAFVHRGLIGQAPGGQPAFAFSGSDACLDAAPGIAATCGRGGLAWIGVRGLTDVTLSDSAPDAAHRLESAAENAAHLVLHTLETVPFAPRAFADPCRDGAAPGPEMVWLPGGSFRMGSPEGVGSSDERPAHAVRLEHYAIGTFPVTVGEFRRFVAATGYRTEAEAGDGAYVRDQGQWREKSDASWRKPYMEQDDRHPVVCLSWNDAHAYCDWLSSATGQTYGLLTEAQWEHACRAGSAAAYCFGDDPAGLDACLVRRQRGRVHPSGRLEAPQRLGPARPARQCLGVVPGLVCVGLLRPVRERPRRVRYADR